MYRSCVLFIICIACLCNSVAAQQLNIEGIVYKKTTADRVAQVLITNQRNKIIRISDELGMFHIPAMVGDTLFFKKAEYTPFYFVISSAAGINIYLQPAQILKEVAIEAKGINKKEEVNDVMNEYKTHGQYYTLKPSVWSLINSPITGFYELFGKEPNRARAFQRHSQEELDHIEVTRRYSTTLIKRVTGMDDDKQVRDFTDIFTPSVADIRQWNDYELISYIKRSYVYFVKNKDAPKLPKLE